ncbi:MAG: S46 family peptidase [Rikenellaceae bacterium]
MKKLFLLAISVLLMTPAAALADEGMWLLPFLKDKNIKDMRKAGFKLSAEDIYSVNKHALKDAIVIFGGGCTGEVISPEGLVLTNHHCGYGSIQQHSTVENDYLANGFWAMSNEEEIPTPGLAVTFIRSIEDVTEAVTANVTEGMTEEERLTAISEELKKMSEELSDKENNLTARIVPMFGGNQYILFMQERFGDVRMVGAPPSSIGKFGGETDNWMWPRHTGDFSMFRIYSTEDGKSTSEYSKDNVPYQAPKHLTISSKGVKEGDFAMIMGFPGSTNRYMTTWEIDRVLNQENPLRIFVRGEKQAIWGADMAASQKVRIQYASKYAQSSNYWKNSIGMSRGLKRLNVRGVKQSDQDAFTAWVNEDAARVEKYGSALQFIQEAIEESLPAERTVQMINEVLVSAEAYFFAYQLQGILGSEEMSDEDKVEALTARAEAFFKNYNAPTDKKATYRLFEIYADSVATEDIPSFLNFSFGKSYNEDFDRSPFTDEARFMDVVNSDFNELKEENIFKQAIEFTPIIRKAYGAANEIDAKFSEGHRLYLEGLLEMNAGKRAMYPDANFTIRLTYGNVEAYKAADATNFDFYTTLSGVMEKEDPTNAEFVVPARLKELYEAKDFGRWGKDDIVTCFISTNDITGGNSGSPVMNGKGELIGLAFDGNWEAMSGDIAFEPELQRTISMDIRYVMFIIEKYAGCTRLIDEMTIK